MNDIEMEVVVQAPRNRVARLEAVDDDIREAANGVPCRVSMHPFSHSWESGRFSRHAPEMHFERVSDNVAIRFRMIGSHNIDASAWTSDMRESALQMADVVEASL